MASKTLRDSVNQYECSIATPRSNWLCTFASQEVGNVTLPSFSCARPGHGHARAHTTTTRADVILIAPSPALPAGSSGDPAVPAVARRGALVEVRHLHPAQVIVRNLVAPGVDVDAEEPRGVHAKDLLLHRAREPRVRVPLDQRRGNLEAPERLD